VDSTQPEVKRVLNEERRRAIVEMVNQNGRVLVQELGQRFATSQVTIRKDLEILHGRGLLHRTHGGALPLTSGALLDPSLREKEKLHRREKQRIGQVAAQLVKEGQSVVLDSGTTTSMIARELRAFRRLTVITNAVNIAAELAGTPIEVILTGGVLRENSFSLVGPLAEDALRHLSADILFLGVDGFDVHFGLTTPNLLEAKVNRGAFRLEPAMRGGLTQRSTDLFTLLVKNQDIGCEGVRFIEIARVDWLGRPWPDSRTKT